MAIAALAPLVTMPTDPSSVSVILSGLTIRPLRFLNYQASENLSQEWARFMREFVQDEVMCCRWEAAQPLQSASLPWLLNKNGL